jgi:uncharacterized protein with von Willebrand factor type A (vWA) domain
MKIERSILNFQESHAIITNDGYYTFRIVLKNVIRREIFDELKGRAEKQLFKNTFEELCEDIFYSYYNKKLDARPEEFIKLRFLLNYTIVNKLIETKVHKERRLGVNSTIQAEIPCFQVLLLDIEEILNKLDDYLANDQKDDLDRLSDRINNYENSSRKSGEGEGLSGGPGDGQSGEEEGAPDELGSSRSEKVLRNELDNWLDSNDEAIKKAISDGLNDSKKLETESEGTLKNVLGGFLQGHEKGDLQRIPIHQRIELAKTLSKADKIKEIVEYLGRFRIIAQIKQVEKVSEVKIQPTNVTLGGNLSKALPTEIARFGGNEFTRKDALLRWASNQLLQTDPPPEPERENIGKGSVIICIDTSGSMSGIKEYKSKALAFAVAEVAYQQNRNFACILFSSSYNDPIVIEISPVEQIDTIAGKVISIAQNFYGGGTDFELPLEQAISIIEKDEFNNADILFLTDGFADMKKNFLEKYQNLKKEKGFKTVGLLLDASDAERNQGKASLEAFCDDIKLSSEIEKDEEFRNSNDVANDVFLLL